MICNNRRREVIHIKIKVVMKEILTSNLLTKRNHNCKSDHPLPKQFNL